MTVVTPRLRLPRFDRDSPLARARGEIMRRRRALPRPASYVVLCGTVAVLNIVGLVMILSASSVAALSDYGSSWYFFDRQLMWAVFGLIAFDSLAGHTGNVVVAAIALTVLVSVVAHGITARPFSRWYGAHVTALGDDVPERSAVPALAGRPRVAPHSKSSRATGAGC